MKKIVAGSFLLLLVVAGLAWKTEDDPIKAIIDKLTAFFEKNPQEKIYLHLDKPFYAIGDNIWFKAYVVTGEEHRLSNISKIIYVDLINEKDSIKQTLKLPLTAGMARGDFALADTLAEGNYRIRAYTNWMRNFDTQYFFDQTVRITNAISNSVFTSSDFRFSGEGNQQNVEARITYTDLDGKPYADKTVSYEVMLDSRQIARGKGTTDASGVLDLRFENRQPFILKSGRITTSIRVDDKISVTKIIPVKTTSAKVDVQFFPEGGNLLNNVRSRMAFKAVGPDGRGVNIRGMILEDGSREVVTFGDAHLGMGAFSYVPLEGKQYTARITFPDGSERSEKLPQAVNTGFSLAVFDTDDQHFTVRITPSPGALSQANESLSLVAQSSGKVYFAAKSTVEKNTFSATVAKSRFPSGIVQFTLFNGAGEPMNERIVFVNRQDKLNITVTPDKPAYQPRQKTRMTMEVKDPSGKPVQGSFSVAITNEGLVPKNEASGNMLSTLLLTSDIKGYVENPGSYFKDDSEKTRSDLDMLMLTQGYRRFEWRQLMNNVLPVLSFQPEKTMDISGRITQGSKPVANGKIMLFSTLGGTTIIDTLSDENGRFRFHDLVFPDSARFVIQARTARDKKNVEIELDDIPPQVITRNKNTGDISLSMSDVQKKYTENSRDLYEDRRKNGLVSRTIRLGEVRITDKKNPVKNSANLNGAGNADQVIRADQLMQGCFYLAQCLQGRLVGVIFRGNRAYSTRSNGAPMEIFLDGTPVGADGLDFVNPQDVETIEVLRSGASLSIYGMRGGNGILLITTKRGQPNYNYNRYAPGVLAIGPKGFAKVREFYAPNYDNPKTNEKPADLRTTLYWNPVIVTDSLGKASFDYFNSDAKGIMRAVIEGIDLQGHLAHSEFEYRVQ
ncbi:MAG: TonB-dependent receptor plug domain-containing protein [Mucilaginibacter polytrichastri]|nr:TonB-dependent receptor plug domain-containing protein [Mucilaginibacter polytrichastri]